LWFSAPGPDVNRKTRKEDAVASAGFCHADHPHPHSPKRQKCTAAILRNIVLARLADARKIIALVGAPYIDIVGGPHRINGALDQTPFFHRHGFDGSRLG
jgi:hypothetical protein